MTTTVKHFALTRTHLLREDPDLGRNIAKTDLPWAIEHCVAPVMTIERGAWTVPPMRTVRDGIGLLVLDGLLLRRVGVDGRFGAELIGEGDVVRPWQSEVEESSLPQSSDWRVLTRTRMAVLDAGVAGRLARYPLMTGRLVERALDRARRLSLVMAIVHQPRIETRLHMMLWYLADRWGRVRSDGVLVPLRLSHSMLADLIAAQRPSVTAGLRKLSDRGLTVLVDDGWLLCGPPPVDLLDLGELAIGPCAVSA